MFQAGAGAVAQVQSHKHKQAQGVGAKLSGKHTYINHGYLSK
jgi:hypothetical protein